LNFTVGNGEFSVPVPNFLVNFPIWGPI
jgi:hypothetical protein